MNDGTLPLSAFVPDVLDRCKEKNLICKADSPSSSSSRSSSLEVVPCTTRAAMPATQRKGPATPRIPK
eukprot:11722389-Karenia_brevis.AAC.1